MTEMNWDEHRPIRERIWIRRERFAENSSLSSWRSQLRPLLSNGFSKLMESRPGFDAFQRACGQAALRRAEAILGGQVVCDQQQDWIVSGTLRIRIEGNANQGVVWMVMTLAYLIVNQIQAELVIECPDQDLNRNQQKMLAEMMVLYEAVNGIVAISENDSPYFQRNMAEDCRRFGNPAVMSAAD